MKSTLIKISAAITLMAVSVFAYAATGADCCTSIECCIKMLASCC